MTFRALASFHVPGGTVSVENVLPRSRGSRPSRELPRGAASGVSKQVILGLTAGSIMPVDRKANDSVGYFGKMPYSGYFGSPFSVGCVGYFGSNSPRRITKLPRRFASRLTGV